MVYKLLFHMLTCRYTVKSREKPLSSRPAATLPYSSCATRQSRFQPAKQSIPLVKAWACLPAAEVRPSFAIADVHRYAGV